MGGMGGMQWVDEQEDLTYRVAHEDPRVADAEDLEAVRWLHIDGLHDVFQVLVAPDDSVVINVLPAELGAALEIGGDPVLCQHKSVTQSINYSTKIPSSRFIINIILH
jgi:hypothetical protein